MLIRPTAFTIGLIIYSFITLFVVYTEFGIDSKTPCLWGFSVAVITAKKSQKCTNVTQNHMKSQKITRKTGTMKGFSLKLYSNLLIITDRRCTSTLEYSAFLYFYSIQFLHHCWTIFVSFAPISKNIFHNLTAAFDRQHMAKFIRPISIGRTLCSLCCLMIQIVSI